MEIIKCLARKTNRKQTRRYINDYVDNDDAYTLRSLLSLLVMD